MMLPKSVFTKRTQFTHRRPQAKAPKGLTTRQPPQKRWSSPRTLGAMGARFDVYLVADSIRWRQGGFCSKVTSAHRPAPCLRARFSMFLNWRL